MGASIVFNPFTGTFDFTGSGSGGGGGTPGGNDTDVQFNNAGTFGGSDFFTWATRTVRGGTALGVQAGPADSSFNPLLQGYTGAPHIFRNISTGVQGSDCVGVMSQNVNGDIYGLISVCLGKTGIHSLEGDAYLSGSDHATGTALDAFAEVNGTIGAVDDGRIIGFYASLGADGATTTNAQISGVFIDSFYKTNSATVATVYGLRIANQTVGATNYAILTGTGLVQFGGLTSDGFVKTTGGTGLLSIDTNTYLTSIAPLHITDANTVEQYNSTNAQLFNVYLTRTDASNGSWLRIGALAGMAYIYTDKNGSGSLQDLNFALPSGNAVALNLTASNTAQNAINLGNIAITTASDGYRVGLNTGGGVLSLSSTAGTHTDFQIGTDVHPTATSTMVWRGLSVVPTINFANGTPGAGSYEAIRIAVTETALPTGTNYLIRASAGAAGTTAKFSVDNAGTTLVSGSFPVIYKTSTVAVTAQTADIADTALTLNGTGLYSVTYYLLTTTADGAAGTVKLAIKYTDDSGAKEIDSSAVTLTAVTGFDAGGPITVRTASGSVTYGTTHTGSYGTSQYALYITLEKLN